MTCRVVAAASAAFAIALLSSCSSSKSHPNEKEVTAAEDEVYEAVVRDLVTRNPGQANISQLVLESARKRLRFEPNIPPVYDSLADRLYRVLDRVYLALAGGGDDGDDGSLRADTIRDFLEKSCTAGRLSQTFHTDLPRTFVGVENVYGSSSFEQVFPGAAGIISFSHVGFDSTLHEAIVSTAVFCGHLCGMGRRYILRKKRAKWEVVGKLMVWVS